MRRVLLLCALAGCALAGCALAGCAALSWSVTTLDALVILSGVALGAAGLLSREFSGEPADSVPDFRSGVLSFACLLCGAAVLLMLTGTTSLDGIRATLTANYQPQRGDLLIGQASLLGVLAAVLVLAGAALPIGLFPFHFWQTSLFRRTSGWQALGMAALLRLQGLGLLIRVLDAASAGSETAVQIVVGVAGGASALAGAALLYRTESLRMIAAHLWLVCGGLAVTVFSLSVTLSQDSVALSVAGLPSAATLALPITAIGLLIGISLLAHETRLTRDGRSPQYFEELTGLARQAPATAFLLGATLLSLVPVPPLPAFWLLLLMGGNAFVPGTGPDGRQLELPGAVPLMMLAVTAIAFLLIAARLAQPVGRMLHHEPLRRWETGPGRWPLVVASLCVALLLLSGLLPGLLLEFCGQFV